MVECYERGMIANDTVQPMHSDKCNSIDSAKLANNQREQNSCGNC